VTETAYLRKTVVTLERALRERDKEIQEYLVEIEQLRDIIVQSLAGLREIVKGLNYGM